MAPGPQAERPAVSTTAIVVTLTAVAVALRIPGANTGLWIDEIYALVHSFRPPLDQIVTTFRHDNHHPFYSVLAHLGIALFGEAPWVVRLPSILIGAASVPLLFGLGLRIGGRREAAVAAALLAVSYHHIWFSQNARGYVILAACTILASTLLLDLIERGRWSTAAGYAIVVALGAYTHLTMVFIAVGQVAAGAVAMPGARGRPRLAPLAAAFGGAAVLTLLLYAPMLGQVIEHFLHRPSRFTAVSTPGWALAESIRVLMSGFGGGSALIGGLVVLLGGVVFLAGLIDLIRRSPIVGALAIGPGLALAAGAVLARGTFYPRFLFALAPLGILVAVAGIGVSVAWVAGRVGAGDRVAGRATDLVYTLAIVASLAALPRLYRVPKQDYRAAVLHVEQALRPGDQPAAAGAAGFAIREYLGRDWPAVDGPAALEALRRQGPVWLVWTLPRYLEPEAPGLLAVLESDCQAAATFPGTVGGGHLHLCRLEGVP